MLRAAAIILVSSLVEDQEMSMLITVCWLASNSTGLDIEIKGKENSLRTIQWAISSGDTESITTILGEVRGLICGDRLEYTGWKDVFGVFHGIDFLHVDGYDIRHERSAVLDHESPVCLSKPAWIGTVKFVGQASEVRNTQCVSDGPGNSGEIL